MAYVAKVNFDAGKGLSFKKGELVQASDDLLSVFISEGLVEKVAEQSSPAVEVTLPIPSAPKAKKKKG